MHASCLGLKHCEGSEGRNFSVSVSTWALTIRPKISNIWVYLTRWSSFTEFMQIPNFLYSVLASSFGRDHSELDISCKDDAHSIKETP